MARLAEIEGIGEKFETKLKEAGVVSVADLLKKGASAKGREELVEKTGISSSLMLKWVNHADLFRIKGIGPEYSELLECAGVDSVPELAQRRADNLMQKIATTNEEKKCVRRIPRLAQVESWIEQAKKLPKIVTH